MTATLTDHTDERWKRLVDELDNFQEIARYLDPAPGQIPELDGVDICGMSLPLRGRIGGDHILYIDFKRRYDLPARIAEAEAGGRLEVARKLRELEHRGGILVADVSGHRMTDALLAAMLHQAFLLGAYYELDAYGEITTRIFEHINTRFYLTTPANKFFTMIYGEIRDDGKFRFLNAGHPRPAIFSHEYGRFMPVSKDRMVSFPPVGLMPAPKDPVDVPWRAEKKKYTVNEIDLLAPGDILLLYTDGLSEHGEGGYFPGQVERLLADCRNDSAAGICERLGEDLRRSGEPTDDVSVVVIRKTA